MAKISSYRDVVAWQKAHELVLLTYKTTIGLPDFEKFGLANQMRRSVVSIGSNLVEGFARKSIKESLKFYNIAQASLEELKYQYQICSDLGFITKEKYLEIIDLCNQVGRLLYKWSESQAKNYYKANIV